MDGASDKATETVSSPTGKLGSLSPNWSLNTEKSSELEARTKETPRLRFLILEDNPLDCELMIHELLQLGFQFDWERVETEADYRARLSPQINLILSDYVLPQFDGLQALNLLKQRPELDIPFIIISGTIGEETAVAAIKEGAADYLLKDRIARLGPAVHRALKEVAERQERRRLQAQFLEAQKMEVVGHLAAGVAHDFNNVLGVIMGYSDLITGDVGANSALHRYAEEIRHAANRAAGLTRQLLIFSRKETVQATELDLNDIVADLEKMLRRLVDETIDLRIVLGEDLNRISADSGYIWQLLMNLIVNARDAMPSGGSISVQTANVVLDSATTLPDVVAGPYVMLSVTDNGQGMSEETKAHLFEPFFTTKPPGKGTGLGLVTCQTIVRHSRGYIEVSSEVGRGTTFKIYFPRFESMARPVATSATKTGPLPGGTEMILIVEDEPSVRELAQGVLEAQGYRVKTANNGEEALRVAREQKNPPIALVVTDVVMPRMGGKAMAEWLKTLDPKLKILFTSGYSEELIQREGVLQTGVDFLPKPYTLSLLTRKVREMLDSQA